MVYGYNNSYKSQNNRMTIQIIIYIYNSKIFFFCLHFLLANTATIRMVKCSILRYTISDGTDSIHGTVKVLTKQNYKKYTSTLYCFLTSESDDYGYDNMSFLFIDYDYD